MLKFLLGNPVFQFIVGSAIGFYMLFVGMTTRWRKVNPAAMETFFTSQEKHLACIWHGRFTLVHKLWKFGRGAKPAKFLISQSREGGLVAWVSRTVGAEVVRGSAAKRGQRKRGFEAMREMARHLDGGGVMGMTPDGPRGPRMRAKRGPVQLAKLAGASLVPITWSTSNRFVFDSWDNFILPLPFGRGALIWGEAIPVPPDADAAQMEGIRLRLETEMNRICAEADRIAGVSVIEPEPARDEESPEAETVAAAT